MKFQKKKKKKKEMKNVINITLFSTLTKIKLKLFNNQ